MAGLHIGPQKRELTALQTLCVKKRDKSDISSPWLGSWPTEEKTRVVSICRLVEGPDIGGRIFPCGPLTSSVLRIGLCSLYQPLGACRDSKYWNHRRCGLKVCLDAKEVSSGGLCLLPVCRAGDRSAHVGEGWWKAVCVSAAFQSEFIRLKA